jgi:hypothetical protein
MSRTSISVKMSREKRLSKQKNESDLARFARAFENEGHLQDELVILFRRMGRERVRKVHGPLEHGKDIVFYAPGGLDERSLYACVVKNSTITGEAGNEKSLKTVLQQAQEAFEYPYQEPENGTEQRVKTVYVISPFEITAVAQQSVSASLKRHGVVEFVCGASLLDLFSRHYKEFLLDSGVLTSYLSALRAGLQKDDALLQIILQHSFLADTPTSFHQMYVSQTYSQSLTRVSPGPILTEQVAAPHGDVSQSQIQHFESRIRRLEALSRYMQRSRRVTGITSQKISADIESLSKSISAEWQESLTAHVVETQKQFEISMSHSGRSRKAARAARPAPRTLSKNTVIKLSVSASTKAQAAEVDKFRSTIFELIEGNCRYFNSALTLGKYSESEWLISDELLAYCRLLDLSDNFPGTVLFDEQPLQILRFDASFLDRPLKLVLLSAPAGFGKTSFCRWQSVTNAEALLANTSDVLPVYVPLSRYARLLPDSVDDAFWGSPELQQLLRKNERDVRLRLFLDGLDEIPDIERQSKVLDLAREAMQRFPDLQIVITARDYVIGPWLDLIRLDVEGLNQSQQRSLALKWLQDEELVNKFFDRVPKSLQPLLGVPLLATLTLAVFKKHREIPPHRSALYDLFIRLMCGGWDSAKGIQRQDNFGAQPKRVVLERLAAKNHWNRSRDASLEMFSAALRLGLSALRDKGEELLNEVLQDGLLTRTGVGIRFSHLSFQEYLAAEDLGRDPMRERVKKPLKDFLLGDDWWKEVLMFYVTKFDPMTTEEWLVESANAAQASADPAYIISGELDGRLGQLRAAIRESSPHYESRYPADGVVIERKQGRVGSDKVVQSGRRTLTGRKID